MTTTCHKYVNGHHVTDDHGILTIPCLAGEDVSREPGTICVMVIDGEICDARSEQPMEVVDGRPLMGWDQLDGDCYDVSLPGCPAVAVPKGLIDALLGS